MINAVEGLSEVRACHFYCCFDGTCNVNSQGDLFTDPFMLAHIPHTANHFLRRVAGLQKLDFLTLSTHLHRSYFFH